MFALPLLALAVLPQTTGGTAEVLSAELVLVEDQVVPHFGTLRWINDLDVNSSGVWQAAVTGKTGQVDQPAAILQGGVPLLASGDPLALPPGASPVGFRLGALDEDGNAIRHVYVNEPGLEMYDAYYWNDAHPVLVHGAASTIEQLSWRIRYRDFSFLERAGDYLGLRANFEFPNGVWAGQGLTSFRVGSDGTLSDERLHVFSGQVAPKLGHEIIAPAPNENMFAINASRDVLYSVSLDAPEGVLHAVYLNDEPLAVEGDIHGPSGLRYTQPLGTTTHLDLNDAGDHTFMAWLQEDDEPPVAAILRNFEVVAAVGDSVPAIEPFEFWLIPGHPVLDAAGNVYWVGRWGEFGDNQSAIFRNDTPLVTAGTTVSGETIGVFPESSYHLTVSPSGEYLIMEVILEDFRRAALLLRLATD